MTTERFLYLGILEYTNSVDSVEILISNVRVDELAVFTLANVTSVTSLNGTNVVGLGSDRKLFSSGYRKASLAFSEHLMPEWACELWKEAVGMVIFWDVRPLKISETTMKVGPSYSLRRRPPYSFSRVCLEFVFL
jgi:hypothetical protein